MEETFASTLKDSIREILKVTVEEADEISRRLVDEIGVVAQEDLQLLTDEYLAFLKPLQRKKLLIAWKQPGDANCHNEATYAASNQLSSLPSSSSSLQSSNWASNFDVPWDKMPPGMIDVLNKGGRPTPAHRREMVRVLCDAIREITTLPGKKAVDLITNKIAARFPVFKDVLCGDIIGDGSIYLSKQIRNRNDNLKRDEVPKKKPEKVDDSDLGHVNKKVKLSDKYGCCNWQPPVTDSEEIIQRKRMEMVGFLRVNPKSIDQVVLKRLILETFPSQREDINSNIPMSTIAEKWPMLLSENGLHVHFTELVGVNLKQRFEDSLDNKLNRVVTYLKNKQKMKHANPSTSPDENLHDLLVLLTKYFSENIEKLYKVAEITGAQEITNLVELPIAPCLIAYGGTASSSSNYMLLIDGIIVNDSIKSLVEGFLCLFEAFYVFNIQYPEEVATTLEFIQRCLLNINPTRGQKTKQNIKDGLSSKVLSLVNKIANHEWL